MRKLGTLSLRITGVQNIIPKHTHTHTQTHIHTHKKKTTAINLTTSYKLCDVNIIVPSEEEHLVSRVIIDSFVTFYFHLKQIHEKVSNKLNALTRIAPYLNHNQTRLIYCSFFTGQLGYCPLIWTFCSIIIDIFQKQENHYFLKNPRSLPSF